MFKRNLTAAAVALAFPGAVLAQDADLSKIREEIKQMKGTYEQRIQALEQRAKTAESGAGKAESAFNPAVSLILQGTYANTSQDPNTFQITGFVPSGGEVGPPKRSFGLGETELVFSANIDPYFRGVAIAALTPENEVEVEEAYFQTLALGKGFTLKGGRFFSGIGYQNEIHQHAWDFQDAPLPYKAFLGGRLGRTACSCAGLRRPRCFSNLARRHRAATSSREAIATRTEWAAARCSATSAATSDRATRGARACPTCGIRRRTGPTRTWILSAAW